MFAFTTLFHTGNVKQILILTKHDRFSNTFRAPEPVDSRFVLNLDDKLMSVVRNGTRHGAPNARRAIYSNICTTYMVADSEHWTHMGNVFILKRDVRILLGHNPSWCTARRVFPSEFCYPLDSKGSNLSNLFGIFDFKVFVRIPLPFYLMKEFTWMGELRHVTADRRGLDKLCSRRQHGDTWYSHIIS